MDQNRTPDQDRPNPASNKEPADGSRANVRGDQGGGITNRPRAREEQEQAEVPPRGRTKEEEESGNA